MQVIHFDNTESTREAKSRAQESRIFFGRFLTLAFSIPSAFPAVQMGQSAFGPLASRDV